MSLVKEEKVWLTIAVVFAISTLAIISYFFIFTAGEKSGEKTVFEKVGDLFGDTESHPESALGDKVTTTSGGGGGGSGGGGGGDVSDTTTTISNCEVSTIQIAYSMENLNRTYTCNSYDGDICTDKTVYCSREIYNLDPVTQGNFEIELLFIEQGETDEIDTIERTFSIPPKQYELFGGETRVTSTGESGIANQEINCFFNTISVPKKEICV